MYPLEPNQPFQRVVPSAKSTQPFAGGMRGHLHTGMGDIAALTLIALLALTLSACGSSATAQGSSRAASSPTLGAGQTPSATVAPSPTVTATRTTTKTTTSATQAPIKSAPTATATKTVAPSPAIHEVAQSAVLNGTSVGPATATCPQGEVALGGGWSVPTQGAHVYAAKVTGNTWEVYVAHPGAVINLRITAYVECLGGVAGAVVTRSAVAYTAQPNTPDSINTAAAYCASTGVPVGFGFDFSASSATLELRMAEPMTVVNGAWWNFEVFNHDSVAHGYTVYVNCLSHVNVSTNYPTGQLGASVYAGMSETVSVSCPSGIVAGGGFHYTGKSGVGNLYLQHATSTGWQAAIYGVSTDGLIPLVPDAYAVCLTFV